MASPEFSLSVVVPNRNDARFLRRCLESVLAERPAPLEVIVLDDASSDESAAVIERAIAGCGYARLVRNPKTLGATENANEGLSLSRGRYVHFLGANDYVLPGIYAAARAAWSSHPDAGLWSAMVRAVDEEDRSLGVYPSAVISLSDAWLEPAAARRLLYRVGSWLTGQTVIYRREALLALGGFDPRLGALNDLLASHVLASRHGACFTPRPLAAMRLHAGSFLADTLRDEPRFEKVLERIRLEGAKLAPELYSGPALRRTERRLRFSALRSVAQVDAAAALARMRRAPERSLHVLACVARAFPRRLTAALAFLLLRPFDVLPTIWYRYGGRFWLSLRGQ